MSVAIDLGSATGSGALPATPAVRATRPGWRDPRLWIGVAIVAASVVLGARVISAADDSVQVWAAGSDLGAGTRITEADLVAQSVRFTGGSALAGYFTVADELPAEGQLLQNVGAGELVARGAVGSASSSGLLEVPVAVQPEQVPPSVEAGSVVDVYLVGAPDPQAVSRPLSGPVLSQVSVVAAPPLADSFGTSGLRQLVLAVPEEAAAGFFELLGRYDSAVLTVVRRG